MSIRIRKVFSCACTSSIVPDRLAKAPRAARIEGVSDRRSLTDGMRTVDLYSIEKSTHSGSMLIVHLPAEKILIEADLFTSPAPNLPNPTPAPFAPNLLDNVGRLNLAVDWIVPIHGRVVPFTDLSAAAVGSQ